MSRDERMPKHWTCDETGIEITRTKTQEGLDFHTSTGYLLRDVRDEDSEFWTIWEPGNWSEERDPLCSFYYLDDVEPATKYAIIKWALLDLQGKLHEAKQHWRSNRDHT